MKYQNPASSRSNVRSLLSAQPPVGTGGRAIPLSITASLCWVRATRNDFLHRGHAARLPGSIRDARSRTPQCVHVTCTEAIGWITDELVEK